MGGHQLTGRGPGDDGYDEDGYDESQRAEILEATRDGPGDGTILTDLNPDLGEDPDAADEDELTMLSDEVGEESLADDTVADEEEDALQADFDDNAVTDEDLDDGGSVALNP